MSEAPAALGSSERSEPTPQAAPVKLRLDPPRVMQLSRKAVTIGSGVVLTLVGGAFAYALHTTNSGPPKELLNVQSRATADSLAGAPKDYSQIPKLGPPLPGDLGGPILSAQQKGEIVPLPPVGGAASGQPSAADAARQLAAQERDAARISRLFLGGTSGASAAPSPDLSPASAGPAATSGAAAAADSDGTTSGQSGKRAFLAASADRRTTSSDRLSAPVDPNVVQAGSIISAALITGIRSDIPGQITAQVTQNVFDSPTGHILLIPQGARLIGEYASEISFGQNRVLLAWNRLILPDGRSILLDRQPGADGAGFAGLQDGVNYHWGSLAKAAMISTVLGVGAELGSGSDDALTRALRTGTQDTINQSGQQIVRRQLNVTPTLTIRPGFPVLVIVTKDLILAPIGDRR
ncbi:MAG: conjugal transfer protein TraI [Sphingomonas sp. 28-62-20]|jgi:type IV secretory pathway VirB10-like protein|uniref:TrbI/VirB10 family protein n=1 Tax=Sphingomonas sp. 28-62-20 TaxID=1970433 RepID=UPI000BD653F6|nr:MAG: conjugal transfer protein TraI [Sphingomonas sp. 28-62-20]